ncbi:MAG: sn-glycerol-3-phosphate ABC transporter ATP-binding protein UgpC [Dethiobacteria bacterium]|jgi:multiple sugar transport system ATP-binding protein|nr:sn-glycerol-3-phosphate ABC transporter ATP-binding protein UgpC [Bacillota bacterium]HOL16010.1 sn-glycerol-3-phosphate ABC transporter ATP-binding protein UgpC [Bacillota bacterium]
MARVVLKELTKRFDHVVAVESLSAAIEDREFVVLLGPSGCGKTTTLRMIAGLEEITTGEVHIDGRLVNDVPPKDRDIAMVFQNYALYPHMNVYENMAFSLKLRKYPRKVIEERVRRAAKILSIEGLLARKPKQLSGGEKQRVALGRAIVRNPKVFLMDEPLSNLDAKLRVQMRTEICKLHQELGSTVIYVTHDQTEAMTMADRIVIMKDGKVQQIGTPQEIYRRPVNLFVAGFIGSPAMNFLEVAIADSYKLVSPHFSIEAGWGLKEIIEKHKLAGKKAILGIRPENLEDSAFIPARQEKVFVEAQVELIEPLGAEVILYTRIGDLRLAARVNPETAARPGGPIILHLERDKLHLFNPESGEAYR